MSDRVTFDGGKGWCVEERVDIRSTSGERVIEIDGLVARLVQGEIDGVSGTPLSFQTTVERSSCGAAKSGS